MEARASRGDRQVAERRVDNEGNISVERDAAFYGQYSVSIASFERVKGRKGRVAMTE